MKSAWRAEPAPRRRGSAAELPTLAHRLGAVLTPLLTAPSVRERRLAQRAYVALYGLGKRFADRGRRALLRQALAPASTFLDAGANVGYYTLFAARCLGPGGRVLAFEPDPWSRSLLERRLRRRDPRRHAAVEVYPQALGERAALATLHCSRTNRADNRLHLGSGSAAREHVEVEIVRFDELADRHGLSPPESVKVDVQGAELALLRGMERTLARRLPRWVLLEFSPTLLRDAGEDPLELFALAERHGLAVRELDAAGRRREIADPARLVTELGEDYTDLWLERR
jgi:FkbM family methyltransferase